MLLEIIPNFTMTVQSSSDTKDICDQTKLMIRQVQDIVFAGNINDPREQLREEVKNNQNFVAVVT